MKKIYLIDVSSMFFRAFYAIRPLTAPSGLPTNAIFGFLSMITKLMREEKPDYMVFCYDRKEPSFRKELYAEYKANRTEMPPDLALQIPYIKKLADLMGIPSLEIESYEADDIIGSMSKLSRQNDFEVQIVSGDKDFGQLVGDHVILYDTMKEIRYDSAGVLSKWGISPDQVIDYMALVGDSSDNIPGVAGIGPKGAQKLIESFGHLDNIYEKIEQVESASLRKKLLENKEMAFLSKKLVTIFCDIALNKEMDSYKLQGFKKEELRTLLQELNFKVFEKSMLSDSESPAAVVNESEKVQENFKAPVLISINDFSNVFQKNEALWIFTEEQNVYLSRNENKEVDVVYQIQGDLNHIGNLADQLKIEWLGFGLKKIWHQIKIKNPKVNWDSQVAAYVLKAGNTGDFFEEVEKLLFKKIESKDHPEKILIVQKELKKYLEDEIAKINGADVLYQIELPLIPVLYRMEVNGIKLDIASLQNQSESVQKDLTLLEEKIHQLAGEAFNINSPKQLGVVLFEKLQLPVGKKTKTGYSTDTEVLEKLSKEHEIAKFIIEYRELAKLKNTYLEALPLLVDKEQRIHTSFNQTVTTTGRLSSTNPNLQNIPIRTPRGQLVRKAFVANPGEMLLSADYSQIELRILAHYSDDPNLIKAFHENLDIHTATAAEVFGVSLDQVTSDLRRRAKAVNFGIAYGQGAFGLAENLGIARSEAAEIIDKYFKKFPGVRQYIDSMISMAHDKGYVETLFGRRRYIDELKSKSPMIKKFGERAAVNAPMQGTASDIIKKAMVEIYKNMENQDSIKLLLQVHDELVFEGPEDLLLQEKAKIVKAMETVVSLKVPLLVNVELGPNWDEAH
jgi:DNA polymerase-1